MSATNFVLIQCRAEGRMAAKRGDGQRSNPYGGRDAGDCGRAWDEGYRAHLADLGEAYDDEVDGHR
ncbi:hypothetical protein FHW79_005977 [Azospirillum sp. OGB3]|uniref:hypothetical protein n=1 Tax=Azospirillum sp. OGB3 TaxID=2587012 RepID=UPI001605FF82|nr:hypothetical protein [Azospirillum sp. OGB3]MBB3268302.1 hypothetical protein [Azospirillum sp. OGB3]